MHAIYMSRKIAFIPELMYQSLLLVSVTVASGCAFAFNETALHETAEAA